VSDLGRWSEPKLYQPPRVIFNPFPHLFTVSPSFMSSSIFLSLCLVFFKEMILLLTVIPSEGDSVSFYSMCIRMSHIEILTPIQPLHNFTYCTYIFFLHVCVFLIQNGYIFFHLGFDLHSKNDFRWFVLLIKMANATVVVCKDSWSTYFHCFQPTKNSFFVFLGVQCFLLPSAGTMITFVTCNWRGIFSSHMLCMARK